MVPELWHADEQTDTDKTNLIVAFRNFANAPNKTHSTAIAMLD
jgi:hypothetical protein